MRRVIALALLSLALVACGEEPKAPRTKATGGSTAYQGGFNFVVDSLNQGRELESIGRICQGVGSRLYASSPSTDMGPDYLSGCIDAMERENQ